MPTDNHENFSSISTASVSSGQSQMLIGFQHTASCRSLCRCCINYVTTMVHAMSLCNHPMQIDIFRPQQLFFPNSLSFVTVSNPSSQGCRPLNRNQVQNSCQKLTFWVSICIFIIFKGKIVIWYAKRWNKEKLKKDKYISETKGIWYL